MALTKTATTEMDAWAEVSQAGTRVGTKQDLAVNYDSTIHVDVALSSTTAHTGTEVIVQISSDTSDAEDNWHTLTRYVCCVGTAVSLALAATEPVAETTLACTNPATANMDNDGKFKFIKNTTAADCEIVYQSANSGDGGDTITILNGLAHEQDVTTSIIYDIDHAITEAVSQQSISIPFTADSVRVLINNTYDADGSTVFTRTRITEVTGV
jgi:hypothetical protein